MDADPEDVHTPALRPDPTNLNGTLCGFSDMSEMYSWRGGKNDPSTLPCCLFSPTPGRLVQLSWVLRDPKSTH